MPVELSWGILLLRFCAAFLTFLLGVGCFLIALNRGLNYLCDGLYKPILVLAIFILGVGGLVLLSLAVDLRLWFWILLAGTLVIGLGELRRIWINRRSRGEPPISHSGVPFSWKRPTTTFDLQTLCYRVNLPDWRGGPFRVVHLSDFHSHAGLPAAYLQSVIQQANQLQPDLVFITGDFVTGLGRLPQLGELLQGLQSRRGTYAVLGNHDYWAGAEQVAQVVQDAGIHLLRQGSQRVEMGDGNRLWVTGCEEPWSRRPCLPPAAPAGEPRLVLSHSGDSIYHLSRAGVQAVFSGHYHAGQFHLPILGPVIVPSRYGRRFYRGHFLVGGTHLFVSAGVGCAAPAWRLYCPPDFLVVDFSPGSPG